MHRRQPELCRVGLRGWDLGGELSHPSCVAERDSSVRQDCDELQLGTRQWLWGSVLFRLTKRTDHVRSSSQNTPTRERKSASVRATPVVVGHEAFCP